MRRVFARAAVLHAHTPTQYDPTIEDQYQKTLEVDGKARHVEILDTAGQDEYAPLRQTFMNTGNAFVLVFDITDDATFEELEPIKTEIIKAHPRIKQLPFLVVGNKTDLEDERAVTVAEGQKMAEKFAAECHSCTYMEASAKANVNVEEVFVSIVRRVLQLDNEAGKDARAGTGGAVFGAGTTKAAPTPQAVPQQQQQQQQQQSRAQQAPPQTKKKKKGMCAIL